MPHSDSPQFQEGFVICSCIDNSIIVLVILEISQIIGPNTAFAEALDAMWVSIANFRAATLVLVGLDPEEGGCAVRLDYCWFTL